VADKNDSTPDSSKVEQDVEELVRSGQADAAINAGETVRKQAIDALNKAEQIDPKKLRQTVNI